MRKKSLLGLAAGVLLAATGARADVTWEHTATARWSLSPQFLLKAKIYNSWTPQRHRVLLKYSVPDNPTEPKYNRTGSAALIRRLDDDRIIAYSSDAKMFVSEKRSDLIEKMRVNVWKGWSPELSREKAPAFTPEQRERLGAELRAVYEPYMKEVAKPYFRALPNTRTLNNRVARGYRLTWLINSSGEPGNQNGWTRVSMEWWLAPHEAGDEQIASFYKDAMAPYNQPGGLTNSIWLNEAMPVLFAAMPHEVQQAVATLRAPKEAEEMLSGTPLRFYLTVQPPAGGVEIGTLRAEIALTSRRTTDLPPSVWEAPAGYRRFTGDSLNKGMEQAFQKPMVQQAMRQMIIASANVAAPLTSETPAESAEASTP